MGTDFEPGGDTVADWQSGAAGQVKVYFTLEITHQDGSVTKQQCTGTVTEKTDG